MKEVSRKQWIKFGVVIALYLLFLIWVRSWLGLIVVPFIFDIYITKKIPWTFWKNSKNSAVRTVMSWVDAIVFALVAVYFVNLYIFQNYQIPSSSMEKTMLVGDFLYVSKLSFGPRVPNTPLSMPLAQHTLPITNTKSYIEWPQWDYKRIKGTGTVERNDIVVFNFPAGDTVALNFQQTDFYSLAYEEGQRVYRNTVDMDSLTRAEQREVYNQYYNAGRNLILSYPQNYGKVIHRPVDRRENYVKRCVGVPGDTLEIRQTQLYINNQISENPPGLQFVYCVQTTGGLIPDQLFDDLGVSKTDYARSLVSRSAGASYAEIGLDRKNDKGEYCPVYVVPLTAEMHANLTARPNLISKIIIYPEIPHQIYPLNLYTKWDRDNYGPIWVPKRGATIQLTEDNLPIYERCIRTYEGNKLEQRADGIYINDVKTDSYTFQMDYYWMMGDNRHMSADSRYWGFVPEDHVVGKPIRVWLSLDKDKGWFSGKIRWNRIFKKME